MELNHQHLDAAINDVVKHTHNVNGYKDLLTHRHIISPQDVACQELGSLDDLREYKGLPRRFPMEK